MLARLLIDADWKKLGRIVGLCRMFVARHRRTRTVKDLLKGICEAGVALIEDRSVSGRDLEAAVSCALTDLLQVHSLVDRPADPRVAGIVGRETLGQARCISRRVPEAQPDLSHDEFSAVPAPAISLAGFPCARSLCPLLVTPLALVVGGISLALPAVAVHRVPGTLRAVLIDDAGLGYQRRKVLVVIGGNWAGAHIGEHPLREEKVVLAEAVLLDMFLYCLAHLLGDGEPAPVTVLRIRLGEPSRFPRGVVLSVDVDG